MVETVGLLDSQYLFDHFQDQFKRHWKCLTHTVGDT